MSWNAQGDRGSASERPLPIPAVPTVPLHTSSPSLELARGGPIPQTQRLSQSSAAGVPSFPRPASTFGSALGTGTGAPPRPSVSSTTGVPTAAGSDAKSSAQTVRAPYTSAAPSMPSYSGRNSYSYTGSSAATPGPGTAAAMAAAAAAAAATASTFSTGRSALAASPTPASGTGSSSPLLIPRSTMFGGGANHPPPRPFSGTQPLGSTTGIGTGIGTGSSSGSGSVTPGPVAGTGASSPAVGPIPPQPLSQNPSFSQSYDAAAATVTSTPNLATAGASTGTGGLFSTGASPGPASPYLPPAPAGTPAMQPVRTPTLPPQWTPAPSPLIASAPAPGSAAAAPAAPAVPQPQPLTSLSLAAAQSAPSAPYPPLPLRDIAAATAAAAGSGSSAAMPTRFAPSSGPGVGGISTGFAAARAHLVSGASSSSGTTPVTGAGTGAGAGSSHSLCTWSGAGAGAGAGGSSPPVVNRASLSGGSLIASVSGSHTPYVARLSTSGPPGTAGAAAAGVGTGVSTGAGVGAGGSASYSVFGPSAAGAGAVSPAAAASSVAPVFSPSAPAPFISGVGAGTGGGIPGADYLSSVPRYNPLDSEPSPRSAAQHTSDGRPRSLSHFSGTLDHKFPQVHAQVDAGLYTLKRLAQSAKKFSAAVAEFAKELNSDAKSELAHHDKLSLDKAKTHSAAYSSILLTQFAAVQRFEAMAAALEADVHAPAVAVLKELDSIRKGIVSEEMRGSSELLKAREQVARQRSKCHGAWRQLVEADAELQKTFSQLYPSEAGPTTPSGAGGGRGADLSAGLGMASTGAALGSVPPPSASASAGAGGVMDEKARKIVEKKLAAADKKRTTLCQQVQKEFAKCEELVASTARMQHEFTTQLMPSLMQRLEDVERARLRAVDRAATRYRDAFSLGVDFAGPVNDLATAVGRLDGHGDISSFAGGMVAAHGLPPRPAPVEALLPCSSADLSSDAWRAHLHFDPDAVLAAAAGGRGVVTASVAGSAASGFGAEISRALSLAFTGGKPSDGGGSASVYESAATPSSAAGGGSGLLLSPPHAAAGDVVTNHSPHSLARPPAFSVVSPPQPLRPLIIPPVYRCVIGFTPAQQVSFYHDASCPAAPRGLAAAAAAAAAAASPDGPPTAAITECTCGAFAAFPPSRLLIEPTVLATAATGGTDSSSSPSSAATSPVAATLARTPLHGPGAGAGVGSVGTPVSATALAAARHDLVIPHGAYVLVTDLTPSPSSTIASLRAQSPLFAGRTRSLAVASGSGAGQADDAPAAQLVPTGPVGGASPPSGYSGMIFKGGRRCIGAGAGGTTTDAGVAAGAPTVAAGAPPALPTRLSARSIATLRASRPGGAEDPAARAQLFAAAASIGRRMSQVSGAAQPGGSLVAAAVATGAAPQTAPSGASVSTPSAIAGPPTFSPPGGHRHSLSAGPDLLGPSTSTAAAAATAVAEEGCVARYPCGDVVWCGELITAPLTPAAVAVLIASAGSRGPATPLAGAGGAGVGSQPGSQQPTPPKLTGAASASSAVAVAGPSGIGGVGGAATAAEAEGTVSGYAPYGVGSFPASILEPVEFDDAVPLAYLLHVPAAREAFVEHLRGEYSVENYEFWAEARAFRLKARFAVRSEPATARAMVAEAEGICAKYVRNDAPQQVNLRGDVQSAVLKALADAAQNAHSLSPAVFVSAEEEIYRLLSQDSLSRFKKTQAFATLLQQAKLSR